MAFHRMCYRGSLQLLEAMSGNKTVTTLRMGYAKKVGKDIFRPVLKPIVVWYEYVLSVKNPKPNANSNLGHNLLSFLL